MFNNLLMPVSIKRKQWQRYYQTFSTLCPRVFNTTRYTSTWTACLTLLTAFTVPPSKLQLMFDHCFTLLVSAWHSQRERVECNKPGIGALPVLTRALGTQINGFSFRCICFNHSALLQAKSCIPKCSIGKIIINILLPYWLCLCHKNLVTTKKPGHHIS